MQEIGKYLLAAGGFAILLGLVLYFWGDKFTWLGNLPGDIRVEKENFKFYMPITTMIIISVLLSFILWILRKLF